MSKFLDNNGLLYLWSKINTRLSGKVDAVEGKGLSANDYTAADKAKLDSLVNYTLPAATEEVLGGVKVGSGLSVSDGVLSAAVDWSNVQNKPDLTAAEVDWASIQNKPELAMKSDLASLYRYRGSVTNYASLPADGNAAGDVWNVEATGMNYAWTGEGWDALGQSFELQVITNAEIDSITSEG